MKKQAEIVLFIKKAVFVGIIFGIIFSPIVLGVVRGSDRSWSAIWLSWTDDPRTSITISWRWDQVRRPYIIIWNETFRKIINITQDGDIFHVNIGGLSPNTEYSYVIGYFNGLD
ncbi:MAG: fibronectin type III domain-containing protein, partial [Candidatus Njordarchaeota archaeon]